jgi:ribosomal protein S18 acetylase RimI-like enzyme
MIRPITEDDSVAVSQLAVDAGLFPPEEIVFIEKMMSDFFGHNIREAHECVVDVEGSELLGVAYYEPALATDRTWYLTMIGVRRDHQGQGRGAALMRYVEDALRERGERILLVETSGTTEFVLTRKFYEKLGYHEEASVRDYFTVGDDMVLFRKVLNSA